MDLGLSGRWALVTGASEGIGTAIARGLAAEGVNLHLASRSATKLEQTKGEISSESDVEVTMHAVDLRNPRQVDQLAESCAGAEILINNAGATPPGSLTAMNREFWRETWELKPLAYIDLARGLFQEMEDRYASGRPHLCDLREGGEGSSIGRSRWGVEASTGRGM